MQNPFEYSDTNKRYHTLEYENRRRYGGRVVKVPLDAGFTCRISMDAGDGADAPTVPPGAAASMPVYPAHP